MTNQKHPFPTAISCCLERSLFAFGCGVVEHHAWTGSDGTVVCDRATQGKNYDFIRQSDVASRDAEPA